MGYFEQIEQLKKSLQDYSAEEGKIAGLYKTAIDNAEKEYARAQQQRDKQYYLDRNTAYADSVREDRNTSNMLAARGLGFSGEAAQAKLNANVNLSNRLGEIRRDRHNADIEAGVEFADRKADIEADRISRMKDLLEAKSDIYADIAHMELDRENAEADRRAEAEMQKAELDAKQEMLFAELEAKYGGGDGALGSGGSGGSGGGGSGSSGNENIDEDMQNGDNGYIPDISAQQLAQKIVSSTGSKSLTEDKAEYMVNRFLLEISKNYDMNPNYYDELIFNLKSYGYTVKSEPLMRVQVAAYDARVFYEEAYDKIYNKVTLETESVITAMRVAKAAAKEKQMEFVYGRVSNNMEFRLCCRELGISEEDITKFEQLKRSDMD